MEKILLIDDDPAVRKTLKSLFESERYAFEVAKNGTAGLAALRTTPPSLVILDLNLRGIHRCDVFREITNAAPFLPIIILSSLSDELDKVWLLELGADDCVTKPFSPKELLARVRAVLRRARRHALVPERFTFDSIFVDFPKMELTRAGHPVALTSQEFKILKYLTQNSDRVISREELLHNVWNYGNSPSTRIVDYYIVALRRKLEKDLSNPLHFRTVHGVGYRFVP